VGSVAAVRRSESGALASPRSEPFDWASFDVGAKRVLDITGALALLVLSAPVFALCALAVRLEGRGPVLYRCTRVGRGGVEFAMLKFRKMRDGVGGSRLTGGHDERFTRVGRILAKFKLDELPQLVNVLRGEMSLIGPRPEDAAFVALAPTQFAPVLRVRPGVTGLSQLAFTCESEILDRAADREAAYLERVLPQKLALDNFYATRRTLGLDARIFFWTLVAVVFRSDVAVHRESGHLGRRRRRRSTDSRPLEAG